MGTAWITSMGKGIVDGDGHLLLCDECPCGGGFDCEAAVREAIRERQPPAGRTQWTVSEAAAKSYTECRNEVGLIAVSFTLDDMDEGFYSGPRPLSSSYGSSAADWCELYEWIRVLTTTVLTVDIATNYLSRAQGWFERLAGQNWSSSYPASGTTIFGMPWSHLISNCAVLWTQHGSNRNSPRCRCILTNDAATGQSATTNAKGVILRLYAPGCATTVSARVYLLFNDYGMGTFANQGWTAYGEGQYSLLWETDTWGQWFDGAGKEWKMWTGNEWPERPIAFPSTWPPDPGDPFSTTAVGMRGSMLCYLLDWDFVYV